jgi:hypothetical protein
MKLLKHVDEQNPGLPGFMLAAAVSLMSYSRGTVFPAQPSGLRRGF